jgi:hypothetical protein
MGTELLETKCQVAYYCHWTVKNIGAKRNENVLEALYRVSGMVLFFPSLAPLNRVAMQHPPGLTMCSSKNHGVRLLRTAG